MQSKSQISRLDEEPIRTEILEAIEDGHTNASIARTCGASEKSIRRFRKRHGVNPKAFEPAFTEIKGDVAEAATAPSTILTDPDTMLRQRGLDPEEWIIAGLRANEYQGPASAEHAEKTGENKVTYYQTRFNVVRKRPVQIVAARSDGWVAPTKWRRGDPHDSYLVVVTGDQQAPYQDPDLHVRFCQWLQDNRPERGVLLGDIVDFPDISRHPNDPENDAAVNECTQAGYDLLRDYVSSNIDTEWELMPGNHCERIRNLLLNNHKATPLYGVKRADTPEDNGAEVLTLPHLMRLDELGVKWIDPHGKYDLAQIVLTPKLAVRHGWLARKGSGASALSTLDHLGYSIIVGHTHRQSVVHSTKHEIDHELRVLTGVETGCMCRVRQSVGEDGRIWPNYTVAPDWQQGFATVEIWPDGYFNIDTAKFVNGELLWRDQRY